MRVLAVSLAAVFMLMGVPALASAASANSIRSAAASADLELSRPEEEGQEADRRRQEQEKGQGTPRNPTVSSCRGVRPAPWAARELSASADRRAMPSKQAIPHVAALCGHAQGRPLPDCACCAAISTTPSPREASCPRANFGVIREAGGRRAGGRPGHRGAAQAGRRPLAGYLPGVRVVVGENGFGVIRRHRPAARPGPAARCELLAARCPTMLNRARAFALARHRG